MIRPGNDQAATAAANSPTEGHRLPSNLATVAGVALQTQLLKIHPTTAYQGRRSPIYEGGKQTRVHLKNSGRRWVLVVDERPIISSSDQRWLRRVAVDVRRRLIGVV
jgi:hypothetical protein